MKSPARHVHVVGAVPFQSNLGVRNENSHDDSVGRIRRLVDGVQHG
jgi:hypothetical protein